MSTPFFFFWRKVARKNPKAPFPRSQPFFLLSPTVMHLSLIRMPPFLAKLPSALGHPMRDHGPATCGSVIDWTRVFLKVVRNTPSVMLPARRYCSVTRDPKIRRTCCLAGTKCALLLGWKRFMTFYLTASFFDLKPLATVLYVLCINSAASI